MRRPLAVAALAAAAVATGAAGPGGDDAAALDLRTAGGPALATSAAEGNLGVLRGRAGHRRAGAFAVGNVAMSPSLGVGDVVLFDRTAYRAAPPVRGDVVVVETTTAQAEVCGTTAPRIARVVGVPGDVVTLDGFGVNVNGAPLVIAGAGRPALNRTFPAVPEGRVLVLGDNRRAACDSASWHPPFVAVDAIAGRAEGVFHPRAHAGLLRRDGGLDRLTPDPARRARLDAFMTAGDGGQSVGGALFGVASARPSRRCASRRPRAGWP
ncbi:MAG: signal peptidase I [Thermoleophilia bacterium]